MRLFDAPLTSLEHWVSEESAPTEYSYPSSDVAWVSRWQAYGYLRVTRRKNSHIIYFVTGYWTKDPYHLDERAHCYFYHSELTVFINKRLTLTPTANFVSRHLQLCSSLGYVLYITPLLLPRIHCGQATSAAGSEADVLLSRRVPIFGEHRFEAHSISFSWFFGISSLRKWKPAAPESHWDMCISGSNIRFIDRTLPEMKYMFHALYMHVSDRTPGRPTSYVIANKLRKRSYMYHVRRV